MNKKKVLSLALVVIMIAILSFSSLAWFTDSDTVENDFLVAGSDETDPDDIFSVDVWEDKDGDGDADDDILGDGEGLTYEDILPGDLLKKHVFVENTGSYDQYIRVTVTISDAEAWINALGADAGEAAVTAIFNGFDITKWSHIENNLNDGPQIPENIVYVLHYKEILPVNEKLTVFTDVKIPTSLTQEQAFAFGADGFSIDVKADAVQTRNVVPEGTAPEDAAWAAFKTIESTNP